MTGTEELRNTSRRIRKALSVHVGEQTGNDLADLIDSLIDRVQLLERTKVDVMPVVPVQQPIVGLQSVE